MARTAPGTLAFARSLRSAPTDAEHVLWPYLRRRQILGVRFRRQLPIGAYIADFASLQPRLAIELDGSQHVDAAGYDARRSEYLSKQGFRVLRFWNGDVLTDRMAVVDTIWRTLAVMTGEIKE